MANELGEAAISGGLGIINSMVNAHFARKENKKNRQWQEKMYNLSVENNRQDASTAHGRQLELLAAGRENQLQYNREAPQAEVEGYRAAGLNLAGLNQGAGGSIGVGSASAAQAAPASYGNPTTYLPQLLDISQVMKNFAEAKLLSKKTDTEENLQKKYEAEVQKIGQDIIESKNKVNGILSDIAKNNSEINLNSAKTALTNSEKAYTDLQKKITEATKENIIELSREQLENLQEQTKKVKEEIRGLKVEADMKRELWQSKIDLNMQQAKQCSAEYARKMQEVDFNDATFNAQWQILNQTARKLMAEAKNEEDFEKRFDKELEMRGKELKQKKTQQWLQFTGEIIKSGAIVTSAILR